MELRANRATAVTFAGLHLDQWELKRKALRIGAGLADSYVAFAGTPAGEVLPNARAAVERALQLDDFRAEAHVSLGLIQQFSWNFGDAERELMQRIVSGRDAPTTPTASFKTSQEAGARRTSSSAGDQA